MLDISQDQGFRKVLLVSDCLSVIQRISSPIRDRSPVGTVITDIKVQATAFESVSFKFSGRRSNLVAHILAHSSLRLSCNLFVGVIPEFIREELCTDVL